MKKKSFKGGFDALFEGNALSDHAHDSVRAFKEKEKYVRQMHSIKVSTLENIKKIAYWNDKTLKHVFNKALDMFVCKYIEKNGEIKPIPGPIDDDI